MNNLVHSVYVGLLSASPSCLKYRDKKTQSKYAHRCELCEFNLKYRVKWKPD